MSRANRGTRRATDATIRRRMQMLNQATLASRLARTRRRLFVLALATAVILLAVSTRWGGPGVMGVKAQRKPRYLPAGVHLDQALELLRLRPRTGALLDVEGEILDPDRYPGSVRLNGVVVPLTTQVAPGSVIRVRHGRDRREPIRRREVKVPGGEPTNPQFVVGTAPGVMEVREGTISNKVLSTVFRPTGDVKVRREVALTFDDGPWPTSTRQVLSILRRYGVKATFFLVGYLAERYPDVVREEIRAGMTIANHSWDHPEIPPFAGRSDAFIESQIGRTKEVLSRLGGTTKLFRPPGGSTSPELVELADGLGYRVVLWSVDPHDWATGQTASRVAENVLSAVGPGSIVLLHDGGGDQSATIGALPRIIQGIRAKGLKLVALE